MRLNAARRDGFTLIELLVVVTIIGVLMGLFVSAMTSAKTMGKIELARAELAQMESAIQDYKSTLGFYPPDNPNDAAINPLYFELLGSTNGGGNYVTLDASGKISLADLNSKFNRPGLANTSSKAHSSDKTGAPMSFLKHLRPNQVGEIDSSGSTVKILVCSVEWPAGASPGPIAGTTLNPWRYVSSHPTNNPGSYDLWVELMIGSKTYRVSNWGKEPQIGP
jgi:prepilin-type N-terminal cleavage/methylation domain-containing protein